MVKTVPRKLNCTILLSNWCEQVKLPKADRGRRSEIKSIMTLVDHESCFEQLAYPPSTPKTIQKGSRSPQSWLDYIFLLIKFQNLS